MCCVPQHMHKTISLSVNATMGKIKKRKYKMKNKWLESYLGIGLHLDFDVHICITDDLDKKEEKKERVNRASKVNFVAVYRRKRKKASPK